MTRLVGGGPRMESFPANRFGGCQPNGNRRGGGGFYRSPLGDREIEQRTTDDHRSDDPVGHKLDHVLDKLEKFDIWREETDRRFKYLDQNPFREAEPQPKFTDGDDAEFGDYRRRKYGEKGFNNRNPNLEFCEGRERDGRSWETPGFRHPRHHNGGADRSFGRSISCWDPPTVPGADTRCRQTAARKDGPTALRRVRCKQLDIEGLVLLRSLNDARSPEIALCGHAIRPAGHKIGI